MECLGLHVLFYHYWRCANALLYWATQPQSSTQKFTAVQGEPEHLTTKIFATQYHTWKVLRSERQLKSKAHVVAKRMHWFTLKSSTQGFVKDLGADNDEQMVDGNDEDKG